jgi:NAD(P)-binding Rossmann-like domain
VLRTQFVTTFPLEIIGLYEKQFGTGGGMSRTNAYDLVIIGAGIAGSSLACSRTKAGVRVLLLESEIEFRDRVVLSVTRYSAAGTGTSPAVPMLTNKTASIPPFEPLQVGFASFSSSPVLLPTLAALTPFRSSARTRPASLIWFSAAPIPLWPQTLEPACSARMLLRPDPRRCPLLELFLERGKLLAQCLQLSS